MISRRAMRVKGDEDIRLELFANVVLTGGSSLLPGMAERLTKV